MYSSPQDLYDDLVSRTRTGLLPSYDPDKNSCLYRRTMRPEDEVRCVAGIFIPDDKYRPGFDCYGPVDAFVANGQQNVFDLPDWMTIEDLAELQNAHDNACKMGEPFAPAFVDNLNRMLLFAGCELAIPAEVVS
jgi:hypothetical protein